MSGFFYVFGSDTLAHMDATFETSIKVDQATLKTLNTKSDLRGWAQTGSFLAAIAINTAFLVFTWGSWWTIPFFMIQGILINCLYAGVHELSHNTVFKTRNLNAFFGRLFAFSMLMGRDQDKFEHFQHHRHTQDVEQDAEIVGGDPFTLSSYILYMSGITYWTSRIGEVLNLAMGKTHRWPWLSSAQFSVVHKEARLMLLGYAVIAVTSVVIGSTAVLTFWLLPMFCMKWFQQMQNTVEHTGMPHVRDIMQNTRTVKAGPIMRWLFWNMPYHTAHHSYPMIPFYQLPKLHKAVVHSLGQEPPTISHFGFQVQMIKKLRQDGHSAYTDKDISAY